MTNRFVCNEAIKRSFTVLEEAPPAIREICDAKAGEKVGAGEIPLEAFFFRF